MSRVPKKSSWWEEFCSWAYVIIRGVLWGLLFFGSLHLIAYYYRMLSNNGFFAVESMEIAKYVVIGAFLFLVVYKDIIEKLFKIKEWNKRK